MAYYSLHFRWPSVEKKLSELLHNNWEQQHTKMCEHESTLLLDSSVKQVNKYYGSYHMGFSNFKSEGIKALQNTIQYMGEQMLKESLSDCCMVQISQDWGFTPEEKKQSILAGSWDERAEHVHTYKEKYKDILPQEYLEESNHISATYFEKVLKHHFLIQRREKGIEPMLPYTCKGRLPNIYAPTM